MSNVDTILVNIKKLQRQLEETGRQELATLLSEYFENHPSVVALTWTQYTPYFNDGDECVFGVNELEVCFDPDTLSQDQRDYASDEVSIAGVEVPTYESGSYRYSSVKWDQYQVKAFEDAESISEVLQKLSSVMEVVYGNHVRVFVGIDGTKIREYDEHD